MFGTSTACGPKGITASYGRDIRARGRTKRSGYLAQEQSHILLVPTGGGLPSRLLVHSMIGSHTTSLRMGIVYPCAGYYFLKRSLDTRFTGSRNAR